MEIICASICYRGWAEDEVEATLKYAPGIGYRWIEIHGPLTWSLEAIERFDLPGLQSRIQKAGMRCAGLYTPGWGGKDEADALAHAQATASCVDFAEALGAGHVTGTGASRRSEPGALERVILCARAVLEIVPASSPVKLNLEPHFGNVLEQPEDFERVLAACPDPRLGICVDTGHFHAAGVDIPAFIHRFASRIYNVHLKDHLGSTSMGIGRGEIDLAAVIATLREIGYMGDLTLELEVKDPHNLPRYTEEAYFYLSGLLGQKLAERVTPSLKMETVMDQSDLSPQKTARIAFIGAGNHATQSLYPNVPMIAEFELAAVCDLDAGKAQQTARRYGAQPFTNVEEMLDAVQLDGCCVCGPAEMHHAVGLQVLQRGIPLFVEKPSAPSLAQAEELVETAVRTNTWGMVAFMKRFAPANMLAKEFMASPTFGTLSSMTLVHGCGPYTDMRRMMYFNGIHMIDLGRFLGGEVERVYAYSCDGGKGNYGISATWLLENGAVAQLNQNSGQTWRDCFEAVYVTGAQAGIFIDASREVKVMYDGAQFAAGEALELFGFSASHAVSGNMAGWAAGGHYQRGYWGELNHFARACLGLETPTPTLEDGWRNIRLIEAMLESTITGREVQIKRG